LGSATEVLAQSAQDYKGAVLRTETRHAFSSALIAQLPALRRYATALCGNTTVADDLVQDCIERALKQSDKLREQQRLGGWLRSIVHNLYIDELRRRRVRGIEEDISEMSDNSALSAPPEDRGSRKDFVTAMESLSVEHRQILLLVGLEGLNYREIADELAIPIGTVMSRLARARERLRGALETGGAAPAEPSNVTLLSERRMER
jgi:RNA polymerase sigma-70 factor, ECF subfamily